ncbi:hypothetical protein ILYODFUR_028481 [Ilyodon furcidens]|uniref:Uncharacterized protein n=1 Tax=Ilyodon furcidens TaxID=33524 RepID=A0ABV0UJQ9_9TELE
MSPNSEQIPKTNYQPPDSEENPTTKQFLTLNTFLNRVLLNLIRFSTNSSSKDVFLLHICSFLHNSTGDVEPVVSFCTLEESLVKPWSLNFSVMKQKEFQ